MLNYECFRIHLQWGRPGFNPWVGKIPGRRERLPTPVFWPGEVHVLYSPCSSKESNKTEWLSLSFHFRDWHCDELCVYLKFLSGVSYKNFEFKLFTIAFYRHDFEKFKLLLHSTYTVDTIFWNRGDNLICSNCKDLLLFFTFTVLNFVLCSFFFVVVILLLNK